MISILIFRIFIIYLNIVVAPEEKITTVSEAMQIQNIAKHDLLSRNEAVVCTSILTFIHPSYLQDEVEAREKLYKEASTNNSNLLLCTKIARTGIPMLFIGFQLCFWSIGLVHIYTSGVTELV